MDDGSADSTHKYAKGDVFVPIPIAKCMYALGATSNWALVGNLNAAVGANTRKALATVGVSQCILLNTNSTGIGASCFVLIPFDFMQRTFTGTPTGQSDPHGFKLKSLDFAYSVYGSVLVAAPTATFWTEVMTDLTTRDGVRLDTGQVTYENPIGTIVASLPTAIQTSGYAARVNILTPVFVNAVRTQLFGELNFSVQVATGTGGKCEVSNIVANISVALY